MKDACIQTLEKLPGLIRDAEDRLVDAYEQLNHAKNALAEKEAELLLNGKIDGKNAEMRQAQLLQLTKPEREVVRTAESRVSRAKMDFNFFSNQLKAYRAIAKLIEEVD